MRVEVSSERSLVYFAYLGDEHAEDGIVGQRLRYMASQLQWLADLIAASPHRIGVLVPYVAPRAWDAEVRRRVEAHGFAVDPASVAADRRNTFEYRGFRAMQALAAASRPEALIYYCHSKGIVHLEENKMGLFRLHTQVGLTADLAPLLADPALTRAALFPYKFGWCWYNFFWIKAGHMAGRAVDESPDRYHFEALIGDRRDKEGFRGVLGLLDRLPHELTGIAMRDWYAPAETTSPTLAATYDRYARMLAPPPAGAPNDAGPDQPIRSRYGCVASR